MEGKKPKKQESEKQKISLCKVKKKLRTKAQHFFFRKIQAQKEKKKP